MTVRRCPCGTAIEWLRTASGVRVPFNYDLVDIGKAPTEAYTVIRKDNRAVVIRLTPEGARSRQVKRVLVRHECASLRERAALRRAQRRP